MIFGNLNRSNKHEMSIHFMKDVISFVSKVSDSSFNNSKQEINSDDLFAIFYKGSAGEEYRLEAHKKYIDLHYIYKGCDTIAYEPVETCGEVSEAYSEEKDVMFFGGKASNEITLKKNEFAVFFPEDAHSPLIGTKECWKIIFKIKV